MKRSQEIRDEVMLQLYGAGAHITHTAEFITKQANRAGSDYDADEVKSALVTLADDGLVAKEPNEITQVTGFRITSKGTRLWEETH
jgi:predicted transcriptional regulator